MWQSGDRVRRGSRHYRALEQEWRCRVRFSPMGTIAWTNASHCLMDDVFCFFVRYGFASSIDFREVFLEFAGDLQLPLRGNRGRLEGTDANRFAILDTASQKGFERGLLVGREIGGIADHIEVPGCGFGNLPNCFNLILSRKSVSTREASQWELARQELVQRVGSSACRVAGCEVSIARGIR